jgi:type IV pilus assembly protein PilA
MSTDENRQRQAPRPDVFRHDGCLGADVRPCRASWAIDSKGGSAGARSTRRPSRGFTLIEMMIVVVIVGVLATMAVTGYRKMVAESHSTEAVEVINSIRVAQEMWHAETGRYDDVSTTLCLDATCTSLYPQAFFSHPTNASSSSSKVGNYKIQWGGACTSECGNWLLLPVRSPGAVMHGYSTKAGIAGTSLPAISIGGSPITWPEAGAAEEWYLISAVGDVDSDGTASVYLGTSFNGDILTQNAGD